MAELGGLSDKLHDGTEMLYQKELPYGKKGVRVEDDGAHSTPNIETFEAFEWSRNSHRFRFHTKLGLQDIKISQAILNIPNTVCERTLAPTKHPPDGVAT